MLRSVLVRSAEGLSQLIFKGLSTTLAFEKHHGASSSAVRTQKCDFAVERDFEMQRLARAMSHPHIQDLATKGKSICLWRT